jgi:predicted  nucleic acid-binding Zn-ribbon protein
MSVRSQKEIERLQGNIALLLSRLEGAEEDSKRLEDKLNECDETIKKNNIKITELQKQIETLQLAEAFKSTSGNVQEAKDRVGRIMREIDKCIALLNDDGDGE